MLGASRRDVLDHLAARGLESREDPTNRDLSLARNRVRHELIPYLERHFNPAIRETLARSAAVLAEEADVLATAAGALGGMRGRAEHGVYVLPLPALRTAPRALARLGVRRALEETGGRRGVGLRHVDTVLDVAASAAPSGRRVDLPGGREAVFHFDEVRIGRKAAPDAMPFVLPLSVPGTVVLPDGRSLSARPARRPSARGDETVVPVPDAPLVVRTRRPGDRVRSAGRDMSLRRFLMAVRVPARERESLPLVAAGDRVLWIPGQRVESAGDGGGRFVRFEVQPGEGAR
jgi:tRNA(Ile)-lysidine synthase